MEKTRFKIIVVGTGDGETTGVTNKNIYLTRVLEA